MSSHLDRIMRLAQKTGDTLIVHDKTGRDVVIMDVNHYEFMHDMSELHNNFDTSFDTSFDDHDYDHEDDNDNGFDHDYNHDCDCDCGTELYEMSEGEMLDKINRDIAIWRSHKEMDGDIYEGGPMEKDNESYDFMDDVSAHIPEWHKAGDILGNKHPNFFDDEEPQILTPIDTNTDRFVDDDKVFTPEDDFIPNSFSSVEDLKGNYAEDTFDMSLIDKNENDEMMYDSLGEASLGSVADKKDIPFVKHDEEKEEFKEETLDDDEPVFFEEPV